ncbi:hypothetical protein SDC9_191334 [bioreactor metagenome]|uniref:Uncharacterized protein n=1 Tax=bioreactor metagenome TaxID=1076179 RepID=A0A645I5V0_9ZZZZ
MAEKHYFDRLDFRENGVQLQKAPYERKSYTWLKCIRLVIPLVFPVGRKTFFAENRIGFIQPEKRAGCHSDNKLVFNFVRHLNKPQYLMFSFIFFMLILLLHSGQTFGISEKLETISESDLRDGSESV